MTIEVFVCFCVDLVTACGYWEEVICKFLFDLVNILPIESINFSIQSLRSPSSGMGRGILKGKRWNTLEYSTLQKVLEGVKKEQASSHNDQSGVPVKMNFLETMSLIIWESRLSLKSPVKPFFNCNESMDQERRIVVVIDEDDFVVSSAVESYFVKNQIFNTFWIREKQNKIEIKMEEEATGNNSNIEFPNSLSRNSLIELSTSLFLNSKYSQIYYCFIKKELSKKEDLELSEEKEIFYQEETQISKQFQLKIDAKRSIGFLSFVFPQNVIVKIESNCQNLETLECLEESENTEVTISDFPTQVCRLFSTDEGVRLKVAFDLFFPYKDEFAIGIEDCTQFLSSLFASYQMKKEASIPDSSTINESENPIPYVIDSRINTLLSQLDNSKVRALLSQLHCFYFTTNSNVAILHFLKIYFCLNETESEEFGNFIRSHPDLFSKEECNFLMKELLIESDLFDLQSPVAKEKIPNESNTGLVGINKGNDFLPSIPDDNSQESGQYHKSKREMGRSSITVRRILESQYSASHGEILLSPRSAGLRKNHRKPITIVKCNQSTYQLTCQTRGKRILVPETPFKQSLFGELEQKTPINNCNEEDVSVAETPKKILKCRKKLQF